MEERLQKFMARCGVASRRKCEELILDGRIKVNGTVITELGFKINPEKDMVYYMSNLIKPEEIKRYIMLNKPVGVVTTVKDEKNRKTILDLVKVDERIYPIGRLDYDSSGLIILTNDGDLYNKIIHPRSEVFKTYIVKVKGIFDKEKLETLRKGVDIGGYITAPCKARVVWSNSTSSELEISIHEGKNRQIRRMCSSLGHDVISLRRISIGKLILGDLKQSNWRELSEDEIKYLMNL